MELIPAIFQMLLVGIVGAIAVNTAIKKVFKTAPAANAADNAQAPRSTKRLCIEGTTSLLGKDLGFLKGFGLKQADMADVVMYDKLGSLESFPADVINCLAACYQNGACRGIEAAQVAINQRTLESNEAMYFALRHVSGNSPEIYAFVDKAH